MPLILLLGESGSGKSTIAKELCKRYGYKELVSYTDRPKRYEDEQGHIFVTKEEADKILLRQVIKAYTEFDGHRYFCTREQLEECDVYVIDPDGMRDLIKNYDGEKDVLAFYIAVSERQRAIRMLNRGDSPEDVKRRLGHDREKFRDQITVSAIIKNRWLPIAILKIRIFLKIYEMCSKVRH